jgi:tetratricopeptide (TPR) repeat protein
MMNFISNGVRVMALLVLCGSLAQAAGKGAGKGAGRDRGKMQSGHQAGQEILYLYPGEAFSKLDTFEGLNLEDADKLYIKKDFKGAFAAYKAFSFEFAKSKALPYVLLRMGRCLHQLEKRNEAIKGYQDVVDYFPDEVVYAAAALYYIGECHGQNGDDNKKLAVWASLVKDDDYVAQPNSGTALTYLGSAMEKLGKFEEATEYRWRTAVAFLQINPGAAQVARQAVIAHYVMRNPNHEKLKEFYTVASGFDGRGGNVDKPQDDTRYWHTVLNQALGASGNGVDREKVCQYWGPKMGDRFADSDDLRKTWFEVQLAYEKDRSKWAARMEKQFAQKPTTPDRVMQWCDAYGYDPKVRAAFFEKNSKAILAGLKLNDKLNLMERLRRLQMNDEAQSLLRSISLQGLTDEEIRSFAFAASNYQGEEEVMRIFARIKDSSFASKARFDYYVGRSHRNPPYQEKALAEIPTLKKDPKYAGPGLAWSEADLLRTLGRYEEAIKAYQAANRQPDSTWAVTDCLVALKQYPQAIKNVQGLESVGGSVAAQACFKVADIYRIAGDKGKEVDQLRLVLRRYPKSGESSAAHERLESYGVKIIGGEAKTEG